MSAMSKLRALLAKAKDAGCTKAEAETALCLARKIANKMNIKLEDIDMTDDSIETADNYVDLLTIRHEEFYLDGGMSRFAHPANHLFGHIVNAVSIRCVYEHPSAKETEDDSTKVTLIGPDRLIELVKMVYTIIRSAMDYEWEIAKIRLKKAKTRSFAKRLSKTDFQAGMSLQFKDDLRISRKLIADQMTAKQLAVHNKVQKSLDSITSSIFPVLVPAKFDDRSDMSDADIVNKGRRAATKYNIEEIVTSTVLNKKLLT